MRILSAEDNAYDRDCVVTVLKRAGYWVDVVGDGREALDRLEMVPLAYDLLVTDQNMPKLCGVELVRRLRAVRFPGRIIVYSANPQPEDLQQFRELVVDEVVPKANLPQLVAAVGRCASKLRRATSVDPPRN